MNSPKTSIPIQPIDFDIARRVVDDFAATRNVPTQVFPHDPVAQDRGGRGSRPEDARRASPPRTPTRKFTVDLPDYVIDAILSRAFQAKPKRTARYVVLQALQAAGIDVKDVDMVKDGRRPSDTPTST